jgi:hypothetical protein
MANEILTSGFTLPTQGYCYTLRDNGDPQQTLPTGKSTVTLPGMEPEFSPNGVLLFPVTGEVVGDDTLPAACYASYDKDSIVKWTDTLSGHDPTQMVVDLYLSTAIKWLYILVF